MKCNKHGKDLLGSCQWCGRELCEMCIAKRMGRKVYCRNCATNVVEPALPRNPGEKLPNREEDPRGYNDTLKKIFQPR